MTDRDAFWAAQIIASFTREQIRAAVETGEFTDAADAEYLTREILRRQRIIVSKYAQKLAGLAQFRLERTGDTYVLHFTDYRYASNDERALALFSGYTFRLQTIGDQPRLIAEGKLNQPRLELTSEALNQIKQTGAHRNDRGVIELLMGRAGERRVAQVYLYAEEGGPVRIVGVRS
jgi:hypothetical protein